MPKPGGAWKIEDLKASRSVELVVSYGQEGVSNPLHYLLYEEGRGG
jgi:hypothetical protein